MFSPFAKLHRLAKISDDEARAKALFEAVRFEFGLPAMFADMVGKNAAAITDGVTLLGSRAKPRMPDEKQVEAYLRQKWTVPADTPNLAATAGRITAYFHNNMPELDLGWQRLFAFVDLRDAVQDSFDILDTSLGVTFEQRVPGAEIKVRRIVSESKTSVGVLTFSDGIGILDDWLRFQQFWNIEEAMAEFQAGAYDKQASQHYGLLTALSSSIDVAFSTDDTQTLNKAAAKILRAVHGKGYGVSQNSGFEIVCAPEHVGRITKMLTASAGSLIVAYNENVHPVNVHINAVTASTHIPSDSSGYYLVLPGRKLKRGVWEDLDVKSAYNIYQRASDWTGDQKFNAAIGDQAQVARVKFS